jgi:intracellular sulfur oxidation DsrE/DsrF family protein
MKSIIKKWAVAAALVSAIFGISISAQAGYGFQKVAYHVNYDDAKRQAGALRNIQNHINAVGAKNMDIRVVMHGKGLSLLLLPEEAENTKLPKGNATDTMQAKIAGLKDQGVTFKVCATWCQAAIATGVAPVISR